MNGERGSFKLIRRENSEKYLPVGDVMGIWTTELPIISSGIESAVTVSGLVDVLRTVNLRARIAQWRINEDSGMADYKDRWFGLKYQTLLQAIKMRRNGETSIKIGFKPKPGYPPDLIFIFDGGQLPYRTQTGMVNLIRLVPIRELLELVGSFDNISAYRLERKELRFD